MAVSRARSVERSRWAWLWFPPAGPLLGLAFERRAGLPGPRRGVAHKRCASAGEIPGIGRARHGPYPRSRTGGGEIPMVAVMIGVDPHKASHTAVVIGVAEELLAELRVRACASQADRLLA